MITMCFIICCLSGAQLHVFPHDSSSPSTTLTRCRSSHPETDSGAEKPFQITPRHPINHQDWSLKDHKEFFFIGDYWFFGPVVDLKPTTKGLEWSPSYPYAESGPSGGERHYGSIWPTCLVAGQGRGNEVSHVKATVLFHIEKNQVTTIH